MYVGFLCDSGQTGSTEPSTGDSEHCMHINQASMSENGALSCRKQIVNQQNNTNVKYECGGKSPMSDSERNFHCVRVNGILLFFSRFDLTGQLR